MEREPNDNNEASEGDAQSNHIEIENCSSPVDISHNESALDKLKEQKMVDNNTNSVEDDVSATNNDQTIDNEISNIDRKDNDNIVESKCMKEEACNNFIDEAEVSSDITLTLTDMPSEILILISSFLSPRVIVTSLCQVCHHLYDLFSAERYWKTRISLQWPQQYPILEYEDFNWQNACMERELMRKWCRPEENFHHVMFTDGFYAAVDVVHILKGGDLVAVGSRDRKMTLLDISHIDEDKPPKDKVSVAYSTDNLHKGWVWSMASHRDTLVTGCWDKTVRLWDLGGAEVTATSEVKIKSSVLALHYEPGFVAAGGFDKKLYMFDPRAPESLIEKRYHAKPVLSLAADDKYIITSGEDKMYTIFDRAAGKRLKQIPLENFVLDMSYGNGQLWGGDNTGLLHVLDTRDGLFNEETLQTIDVGHSNRVTGVHYTDGGIITCSTDGTIKISQPTIEPGNINTLTAHREAVARVSYSNGILASAGSDISVGIWVPKDRKY